MASLCTIVSLVDGSKIFAKATIDSPCGLQLITVVSHVLVFAGDCFRPDRGLPLRAGHWRVRLERKHGAHHEGSGPPRQQHVCLHVLQEDPGDQPRELHHAGQSPSVLPTIAAAQFHVPSRTLDTIVESTSLHSGLAA